MVVQAMSGMMSAQGGDSEPVANTIAIIDVTTGGMLALSTCLALLHRQRSGGGQRAWCSLAGTATYLQSGEIVRFAGRVPSPVGGRDYLGRDPLDRYYQTSDGWIRVQALEPVTAPALAAAGLEVDAATFDADPAAALGAALAGLTSDAAARRLAAARVPAAPARLISHVVRDPQLLMSEFSHIREAADGSTFVTPGRYAAFSRTPRSGVLHVAGRRRARPPGPGRGRADARGDRGAGQLRGGAGRRAHAAVAAHGLPLTGLGPPGPARGA